MFAQARIQSKALIAIAIVAIMAIAAIGVAFAYTATTTSEDNKALAEYVKLTQGANYQFEDDATLYYDTDNQKTSTTYALLTEKAGSKVNTEITVAEGIKTYTKTTDTTPVYQSGVVALGLKIGESDALKAEFSGASAPATYAVTVSVDGLAWDTADTGSWAYVLTLVSGTNYQFALIKHDSGQAANVTTVTYYAYNTTASQWEVQDSLVLAQDGTNSYSLQYTTTLYIAADLGNTLPGADSNASATVAPPSMDEANFVFTYTDNA